MHYLLYWRVNWHGILQKGQFPGELCLEKILTVSFVLPKLIAKKLLEGVKFERFLV